MHLSQGTCLVWTSENEHNIPSNTRFNQIKIFELVNVQPLYTLNLLVFEFIQALSSFTQSLRVEEQVSCGLIKSFSHYALLATWDQSSTNLQIIIQNWKFLLKKKQFKDVTSATSVDEHRLNRVKFDPNWKSIMKCKLYQWNVMKALFWF